MLNRFRLMSSGGAAVVALSLAFSPALAQRTRPAVPEAPNGLLADQELGKRVHVKAAELPPPKASRAVSNAPLILPYQGQSPRVPDGFVATPFGDGLGDRLVPDYLTRVEKGAFYGWPYAYIARVCQPRARKGEGHDGAGEPFSATKASPRYSSGNCSLS
jgi:hypothetical protein